MIKLENENFNLGELEGKSRKLQVDDFSKIIDSIDDLDDKKKVLWKEIYENAITDRQHAFTMFVKLVKLCEDKSIEHAVHGRTIATYIEKMSRANDQLIKLAEVIRRAEEEAENIDSDDMFNQIKEK